MIKITVNLFYCVFLDNCFFSEFDATNIWYVSDDGLDDNDCHSESVPCKNLQTVLNRVTDGADIYVKSETLSLNMVHGFVWIKGKNQSACIINSSMSYTLQSVNNHHFEITCPGKNLAIFYLQSLSEAVGWICNHVIHTKALNE